MRSWTCLALICSLAVGCGGPDEQPSMGVDIEDMAEPGQAEVSAEWKTPGPPFGPPFLVKDIFPPAEQPPEAGPRSPGPMELVDAGGTLYFRTTFQLTQTTELWRSDGTAPGTFPLLQVPNLDVGLGLSTLSAAGGQVFFVVRTPDGASELWTSHGTVASTRRLRTFTGVPSVTALLGFTDVEGTLFFFRDTTTRPGTGELELWKSDGTVSGTVLVRNLGTGGGFNETAVDGKLFFDHADAEHGVELWVSDGTSSGTRLVRDIYPGSVSSEPSELLAADDELVFLATDPKHGRALWKSDGTREGTRLVAEFEPGPASQFVDLLGVINHRVYFTDSDRAFPGIHLFKVRVDGTCRHRPVLVADIPNTLADNPNVGHPFIREALTTGGKLFVVVEYQLTMAGFPVEDQLWATNGTRQGTYLLSRDLLFSSELDIGPPAPVGDGRVVFGAPRSGRGAVWESNGTPSGTRPVPGTRSLSVARFFTRSDGFMFFSAFTPETGNELWALPIPRGGHTAADR